MFYLYAFWWKLTQKMEFINEGLVLSNEHSVGFQAFHII
jgi:hypothetical protein